MALKIGDVAPEFKLFNSDKTEVSLSDSHGKTRLLLFFPAAFSGGCTKEMCSVRDDIANYNNLDVEVLGISVDTVFALDKFKEVYGLSFQLLSDFNKETCRNYGALHETFALNMKGVGKRSAFIVDKNGIIRYIEILDNPAEVPNFEAIKEVLTSLK
jgi:peroxiredoxin